MGEQPISYGDNEFGAAIVRITGDLDLAAGDSVTDAVAVALVALARPVGREAEVQLDLSDVSFMDCAGLSALLRARRSAVTHGCVVRVGPMSTAVRRLLELSGTLELLVSRELSDPA